MNFLKIIFAIALIGGLSACGNKTESEEETLTTDTLNIAPANDMGQGMAGTENANTGESSATGAGGTSTGATDGSTTGNTDATNINRESSRGVAESGQYNSKEHTPPPPNTDIKKPRHTYGDTAPRMDGVNGVR